jgi:polysaccharide export outer membrane protein
MRILSLLISVVLPAAAFAQSVAFSEHDPRYRLQPSDVLEVHYRYTPEFDQTVTVQPDGFVVLQIVGDVKLQGLTLDQVKTAVLEKASLRLKDPELSLVLKDYEKPYFVVGGQVEHPGRFEMRGNVSAVQAIAIAGGFKDASAKHSQVILFRRVGPDLAKTQILDLKTAMSTSSSEALLDLRAGDMLVVPQNRISKIERFIKIANIGAYIPF